MALGFGFNKAKVLASAEKYVQQGKLHNAISEYEKIVEKDAKDLTVLNTIGDLYARLGQSDKAGDFFRRVGDTYASDGFTVKAIAMYKKLTKLNPGAVSVVQRLAELYTQQGLYNDARQQYLLLADSHIKNNDTAGATRIFQKMLEMDPDNVSLQSKLADLYIKAGKKTEARDIYLSAATSLYERGSVDQADQSLDRMLALDPSNIDALLMRGKIALDAGNGANAAKYLEKVPDIDSRPDGLQALLRAYILGNDAQHAEGVARKLASVHNDLGGVRLYADYLLAGGNSEAALKVYDEYVDRLVVGDTGELTFALQGLSGQLKESPELLEKLREVFQKAGATANIPEVNELLAHAYVKVGKLAQARDLYKELADLEPSNPQHMQNYRQVMARMGEEPTARPMAAGEGSQALFEEEIDTEAPLPPMPEYPAALLEKIANVLTDAELFESYNKPQQAIGPLEAILEKAPQDVRVNQRLISAYTKVGRLKDAARCCDTLKAVYHQADMGREARKYADMATRFRDQAGVPQPEEAVAPVIAVVDEVAADAPSEVPAIPADVGEAHEIDLSSEWESAIAELPAVSSAGSVAETTAQAEAEEEEVHPSAISDLLEEISFYLSQKMFDEARSAISRCERMAPANFALTELKQQLGMALAGAAPVSPETSVEIQDVEAEAPQLSVAEEATVMEYDFESAVAAPVDATGMSAQSTLEVAAPATAEAIEEVAVVEDVPEIEVVAEEDVTEEFEIAAPEPVVEELSFEAPAAVSPLPQPVAEVEIEPEVVETPNSIEEEIPAAEPILAKPPLIAAVDTDKDVLSDFVLDLESALPEDFGVVKAVPIPEPSPMAAAAGASASMPTPAAVSAPEMHAVSTAIPEIAAVASATSVVDVAPPSAESTMLSDLFAEFKEEVGEAAEEREDPDTHYNLGVAFKEMGLLDEAIGELQKVCKAIDNGAEFSQVMQAYTWLANCFVEKGVPEASVKWYEKALTIATNEESRTALHYDLANAYEAAGDRPLALRHFTEVYGTNIDYRDVAERIKALKS